TPRICYHAATNARRSLFPPAQNPSNSHTTSNRKTSEVKATTPEKLAAGFTQDLAHTPTEIKKQLESWVSSCPGNSDSHCPIIEELTK
ncbi:hypothetical protein K6U70_03370, partial [Vibrio vulnificus]|nr:hypothetical protein [Vibrio vulnificus]